MAREPGQKRQRTCIACGALAGKAELLRIVRAPDGAVSFDPTGRAAGRGAYVCSAACLEAASKKGKLARALRTQIGEHDYESIACDLARAQHEACD